MYIYTYLFIYLHIDIDIDMNIFLYTYMKYIHIFIRPSINAADLHRLFQIIASYVMAQRY